MADACRTHGKMRIVYRIMVGKDDKLRLLGRPKRSYEDNSKLILGE